MAPDCPLVMTMMSANSRNCHKAPTQPAKIATLLSFLLLRLVGGVQSAFNCKQVGMHQTKKSSNSSKRFN